MKKGLGAGRWERRVLAYARFFAQSALEADLFEQFAKMLKADFPDFIAVVAYDEKDVLVPESSVAATDEGLWKSYVSEYRLLNPFPRIVATHKLHDETVIFGHWLDQEKLRRSVFFNEFMKKAGGEHALGASISVPGWGRSALSFYRLEEFAAEDVRRIDDLRPFVRNALMLRSLWSEDRNRRTWRDRIEQSESPLVRRSARGTIEPLNASAESVLRAPTSAGEAGRVILAEGGDSMDGTVVSILRRRDFGFTPRETDVVAALQKGLSVAEIGDLLSVSQHTVRSFLKSIYAKAGVHSSLQLIVRLNEIATIPGPSAQSA